MPAPRTLTFRRFQAQLQALVARQGEIRLADMFPRLAEASTPQARRDSAQLFLDILDAFQNTELDRDTPPGAARLKAIAQKAGVSLDDVQSMIEQVAAVNAVVEDMQRRPNAAGEEAP